LEFKKINGFRVASENEELKILTICPRSLKRNFERWLLATRPVF